MRRALRRSRITGRRPPPRRMLRNRTRPSRRPPRRRMTSPLVAAAGGSLVPRGHWRLVAASLRRLLCAGGRTIHGAGSSFVAGGTRPGAGRLCRRMAGEKDRIPALAGSVVLTQREAAGRPSQRSAAGWCETAAAYACPASPASQCAGGPIRLVTVQAGASLAGNDSSDASWTTSSSDMTSPGRSGSSPPASGVGRCAGSSINTSTLFSASCSSPAQTMLSHKPCRSGPPARDRYPAAVLITSWMTRSLSITSSERTNG